MDARDGLEMGGQRLAQSPHTAAEIHRGSKADRRETLRRCDGLVNLYSASLKKRAMIPSAPALARLGKNRPQRVLFAQRGPLPASPFQRLVRMHLGSVGRDHASTSLGCRY